MNEYQHEIEGGEWHGESRVSTASEPTSTEEARREIEQTRGRISATLDAIEDRLDRKKEELKDKADVLRPVRHQVRMHLWPSLGAAFGTGLLLSAIRGGARRHWKDDEEREERRRWRAERRARLRLQAAEPSQHPLQQQNGSGSESSPFGEFGHAIACAIADGMKDRMSRQR